MCIRDRRKVKWPSDLLQKQFRKVISENWKNKVAVYSHPPEKVAEIFDNMAKRNGGVVPTSKLAALCDRLNLHLLVISDDLSFHFKFLDVVTKQAEIQLDEGGYIGRAAFLKWWFAGLNTIRPEQTS
eukprot:TRINITY_DN13626_c0_g1_i1.p1 TRINITY_DN13626_c0_g1~~TRINITY_DN13626_c0_g1_i1.p1  ORF type:complete len:146 (+),score=47.27 TRINITY_DN13626_c0_g1_i1:59-439(+)